MFICESCHKARQERKALESQPLQWTGYSFNTKGQNCPDCTKRFNGQFYQYLNAFELVAELAEAKEKLKNISEARLPFPLTDFTSAGDMVERVKSFPAILNDRDAMREVIRYAEELEEILAEV